MHEFTWKHLATDRDGPASYNCTVIDVDGLSLSQCRGVRFTFMTRCAAIARDHYPERCSRVIVANSPPWMPLVWKVVRPFVDAKTQTKVRIARPGAETLAAFREIADDAQIPAIYGGACARPEDSDLERRLALYLAGLPTRRKEAIKFI